MVRVRQQAHDTAIVGAGLDAARPSLPQPDISRSSPQKRLLPSCLKSRQATDKHTETGTVTERKQRSFRVTHVDSILLHPIAGPDIDHADPRTTALPLVSETPRVRSSPSRKAKPVQTFRFSEDPPGFNEDEDDGSEPYEPTQESDGDSEASDVSFDFGTPTASTARREKKALFRTPLLPRPPLRTVDLKSPILNRQQHAPVSPSKGSKTIAERPLSSSDAESRAILRLYGVLI